MTKSPNSWVTVQFSDINTYTARSINPSMHPAQRFELYSVPAFPTRFPELLLGTEIGSTKQAVEPQDVLVCKINPRINRVWQVGGRGPHQQIASSEWIVMRAKGLCQSFLRFYFTSPSFRELICDGVTGVGGSLTRAQPKRVADFPVPIAPLPEQNRIADKLGVLLARVDACRAHLDLVPDILKRFRQSVLADASSGELTREWREERRIRLSWQEAALGALLTDVRYGTSKKCAYEPSKTPVLRIPNVVDGTINLENMKYADFDEDEKAKLALLPGDLLMIRSNGSVGLVGRTALVSAREAGYLYAGYLIRLRPDTERVRPAYLSVFLGSPALRAAIESTARSTTGVNNINAEEIRGFQVQVPCLEEQDEIIRRVDSLFIWASKLEVCHRATQSRVDFLTPATLAKAFRGELVPQDPNDQPADELLAKIKTEQSTAAAERPRRHKMIKRKQTGMSDTSKEAIRDTILKLKVRTFSFDDLRATVSADYESLKAAVFELLEGPEPIIRQVFNKKAETIQFERVQS